MAFQPPNSLQGWRNNYAQNSGHDQPRLKFTTEAEKRPPLIVIYEARKVLDDEISQPQTLRMVGHGA
jgi:hypothetical protein